MAQPDPQYHASYAAFFAPRTHNFETIDFRVAPSVVNLRSYFPSSTRQYRHQARLAALLGIAIGIVFAFVGLAADQLTRGLTIALYRASETLFNSDRTWPAIIVFILISVFYVLIASMLVVYVAPLGAGSGIPELKSYLNGVRVPGFLALDSLFVKAIGVAFSIAGGLICGKQGPMIHAGAIVGAGMSQAASTRLSWRLNMSCFRFLRTEAWKRDFAAVGAAVGVAVAFGSPMGAWMWVYEEACTHWTWELGIITLGACLTGAAVVRLFNFLSTGLPDGFGLFTVTSIGKLVTDFDGFQYPLKDFPAYIVIGVIGGMVGAMLPLVNKHITLLRYKSIKQPVRRLVEAAVIAMLTAVVRILIPYLVDDCRPVSNNLDEAVAGATLGDYSRFTCAEGQFSTWAVVMYNPTDTVVRAMLFADEAFLPASAVAVALVYYYIFMVWTYGVAVPAGVFFPGFVVGSIYGRLVGIAVQAIFPGRTDVSLSGYAFIGAVSALAGITRTISVAVIALEATGGNDASYASALVAVIAKVVGDFLFQYGIYDLHINLKGIPFLLNVVPKMEQYQKVRVSEVMESSVIGVRRLSKVEGLVNMLDTNDHHGFPVFVKLSPADGSGLGPFHISSDMMDDGNEVEENEGRLSISESSVLEAQATRDDSPRPKKSHPTSIITAGHHGLRATIFDESQIRIVHLSQGGHAEVVGNMVAGTRSLTQMSYSSREASGGTADSQLSEHNSLGRVAEFELIGMIDRGTLLTLLKFECDKALGSGEGEMIARDELDSAWPNPQRLKGDGERDIIERVKQLNIGDNVIDIKYYVDPEPLLMSDRALATGAYKMFRTSGARHILVTNMRSGRVSGIMTRKDILPARIEEIVHGCKQVKTE